MADSYPFQAKSKELARSKPAAGRKDGGQSKKQVAAEQQGTEEDQQISRPHYAANTVATASKQRSKQRLQQRKETAGQFGANSSTVVRRKKITQTPRASYGVSKNTSIPPMPRKLLRLPSPEKMNDYVKSHEGQSVDIVNLLTTKMRDYLVRGNGESVKVTELMNKIVAIFVDDCDYVEADLRLINVFQEAYKNLDKGCFEVVHVATKWNEVFQKKFHGMPWLAIPKNDAKSRRLMVAKYRDPFALWSSCLLIDANGKVMDPVKFSSFYLEMFGAYWYPFTMERINEIRHETGKLQQKLFERSLLVSQDGKYVFNGISEKIPLPVIAEESSFLSNFFSYGDDDFFLCKGEKVPISDLEGKVLGVYFYLNDDVVYSQRAKLEAKLVEVLATNNSEFALLLIPLHFGVDIDVSKQQQSNKIFKKFHVYSLPLMDRRVRRVTNIFNINVQICQDPILVIIGPQGKYVDFHATDIILEYGVEAYPFTRNKVLELEMSRLDGLTHVSLLQDKTLYRAKQQITDIFSELKGKVVLMFIGSFDYNDEELDTKLRQLYLSSRKDNQLEVVYVPCDDVCKIDCCWKMPWIVVTDDCERQELLNNLLKNNLLEAAFHPPQVIVFGRDSRVIMRNGKVCFLNDQGKVNLHDDIANWNLHDDIANWILKKYDFNVESKMYHWYCMMHVSE